MIDQVTTDIVSFIANNKKIFFNERDFQLHLAAALNESGHYDVVDVEYAVPVDVLKEYPWKESILKVDIVVGIGDEFFPIELKYKTKRLREKTNIERFGCLFDCDKIIKDQGARDLGMYGFWKDVFRLEQLRDTFPQRINNGIALLLTNDEGYKCERLKEGVLYNGFSMAEGEHDTEKHWASQQSKLANDDSYPDFNLHSKYTLSWQSCVFEKETFYFTMTVAGADRTNPLPR